MVMDTRQRVQTIPKERADFKKLVATNPNYFGNLEKSPLKPVKKMAGNTTYEEVTCVGFNPALNLLEATIQVKKPNGYGGNLCMAGTTEYIRFFIDYGAGWTNAGLSSFNAHDIADSIDCAKEPTKPLSYVVTSHIDPKTDTCKNPILPKIRAILSWQQVPPDDNPDWPPVWGNVRDQHIQIKPRFPLLADIMELIPKEAIKKLPPLLEAVEPLPIPLPDPPPLKLTQLASLYAINPKGKVSHVEQHRFGLEHITAALSANSQEMLSAAMNEWNAAGLDWVGAVAALDKTKADVSYEELECLGLEYNLERLVATLRIKKPVGYSGELCGPGSKEYVAFWADWNDTCEWTYLNTVDIKVHDIAAIPPDGLAYSAILPVDLNAIRRSCQSPKISRIRAVLSWNSLPSTTDPDALNYWGNRLDRHVQIRPGITVPENQPVISFIGGIGIADINVFSSGLTKPSATFAFGGSPADPWLLNRECPFGGLIIVQGPPNLGYKYRLWARKAGLPLTEQIVKNTFHVANWLGVGSNITPDPVTGYAAYMDTLLNMDQVLGHWTPTGDEKWEIRLEMANPLDVPIGTTPWYSIQLDNTAPRRKPLSPPYQPPAVNCEIHIDSGGDCKDFGKDTLIEGHFVARDEYFGGFTLTTLPSSMSPANPTTPTPNTSQTATFTAGGDEWHLDTSTMLPCGYVVLLQIWDRSIVNSLPDHHNYNYYDVGFCLRQSSTVH
jgi:hypothetical protein